MRIKRYIKKAIKKAKKSLERKCPVGEHPDDRLGWIMDAKMVATQTREVHRMRDALLEGTPLDEVLSGFDGRAFGERIVEYPYFIDWWLRGSRSPAILDIGCVLNNPAVSDFLDERVRDLWFCNPAVEPLVAQRPTYYHVATIEKAFSGGEKFDSITCLSTIEHIGYDNSQYGSMEPAKYSSPTDDTLLESFSRIVDLLSAGGRCLLSVPFGKRVVNIHRITKKPAFQSFDWNSAEAVHRLGEKLGVKVSCTVFAGGANGWARLDKPEEFTLPYGHGFPGSPAVLLIEATKP